MSKLLINESPLVVLPSLAKAIGLNEAIVLQQMHYLLNHSKHIINGEAWIYNSLDNWQMNHFPFLSKMTIKRAFDSLKEKGLIKTATQMKPVRNFKTGKTIWYAINQEVLARLEQNLLSQNDTSISQNDTSMYQNGIFLSQNDIFPINNIIYNKSNIYTKDNTKEYTRDRKKINKKSSVKNFLAEAENLEVDKIEHLESSHDELSQKTESPNLEAVQAFSEVELAFLEANAEAEVDCLLFDEWVGLPNSQSDLNAVETFFDTSLGNHTNQTEKIDSTPLKIDLKGNDSHSKTAKSTSTKKASKEQVLGLLAEFDVTGELANDFIEHRKAKKAPITKTALTVFKREAEKAGISLAAAIENVLLRGWIGFRADWIADKRRGNERTTPKASPYAMIKKDGFTKEYYGTGPVVQYI